MRRYAAFAALLLVALFLAAMPSAHADPAMMTKTEYNAIDAGQTKSHVESACACSGVLFASSTYTQEWQYLTPVGVSYIVYSWVGTLRKTDLEKYWCPSSGSCQITRY